MLKEQLEMAQAMAAPVQMRKKKSKTKSSSSLRNRLSKTFSFGGKKSKKNEAKRMSKMATIPAGRPVSVAHAHAPAPTSVPTPAAAPMTMPVAGTHTAASATTDMFAVQAPVATEDGIVPVAATAASPKATVQRHSLIFSPSSSMV